MSENEKTTEAAAVTQEASPAEEINEASLVTEVSKQKKTKKNKKTESFEKVDPTANLTAKQKLHLNVYDFVSIVMSAFVVIAFVFIFAFRLVGVKGESMESTLYSNDWLITMQKQEYVRGDIVVITEPNYFNEPLIKRVIATGGQTIDIDFSTSTVYVDGEALVEPYINESFMLEKADFIEFPYTVPEGKLFCMGDNRNYSTDSRSNLIGAVDERYILGKAVIRILPFGDADIYDYEQKQ